VCVCMLSSVALSLHIAASVVYGCGWPSVSRD
jgi:hypothetical protein